ncbi:hypothetical protein SO694_00045138 [Aureococcus anophagefferens]|uniref:Uncharacterized protein n=1 Tax=Aureococcus anophagefferens TaxID=44056 RepID=A0ABR1G831_AURAN
MIVDLCSSSDDDEAADAENSHVAAIDLCSDSEEEPFLKANDAAMFAPGGPTGPTRDDRNPKRQRRGESSDGPNPRAAASRAARDLREPAPTDHGDVRLLSDILSGAPPGDSIIRSSVPAEGVLKYTVASRGLGHAMWSCDYHTMGAALIRLFKMLRPSRLRGPAPDPSTFLTLSKDIIGQTNMCIKNLDDVAVELMHWSQYKIYSLLPPSILRAVLNNWPKNGGNKFNRLFPALGPEERKAIKAALNL